MEQFARSNALWRCPSAPCAIKGRRTQCIDHIVLGYRAVSEPTRSERSAAGGGDYPDMSPAPPASGRAFLRVAIGPGVALPAARVRADELAPGSTVLPKAGDRL